MPGAAMNDFGDAVRIGASTALEDEQNLDKVWFNLELFEACANGFIEDVVESFTGRDKADFRWR